MLRIGPIQLDFPVILAALSGYSDAEMRRACRRAGAPYAIHEVVLDKSIVHSPKVRDKLLGTLAPDDHPVAGQLMGAEPGVFAAAALHVVERGYDVVDINFGCPVPKVLGRCRGGYLLGEPRTAIEILRAVRQAVPPSVPVTLKMRRGIDDSAESERNFWTIFDAAFEHGLAAVAVHGRTVRQRYVGRADWSFIARAKRHAGVGVVLGSGDVFTALDAKRMLDECGVDGVWVARGAIGNPWIFAEARAVLAGRPLPDPPGVAEQGRVIREHLDLCVAAHGKEKAARIFRKFGIKYAELHPHEKAVKFAFIDTKNHADMLRVLAEWYDPSRDWPPGKRKHGCGKLVAAGAAMPDDDALTDCGTSLGDAAALDAVTVPGSDAVLGGDTTSCGVEADSVDDGCGVSADA